MALALPEGTNSMNLLYEQLWAEQLHTIYELLSSRWLCWASQWIMLLRWLCWASQWIMLLVTGAAYIIQLFRDFVTLTLELATVGMVVRWIVPRPGSRCLTSLARSGECQRCSNVEVWRPNNRVSAKRVVAINVCCLWWLSQIWGLLIVSLPPMGHLPPWSGHCSRLVTSQHAVLCVYECPTWKQRGLSLRFYGGTSQAIYTSGAPLVKVRLTQTPQNVPLTRLAWKDSLGLRLYELFV